MTDIPCILIAEPIYEGMKPAVYFNRISFWGCTADGRKTKLPDGKHTVNFVVKPMVMGPRKAIRIARAEAIVAALDNRCSHLLFIDDDVLVPQDILSRMLMVDADIVGGLMNRDDGTPLVFKAMPDGGEVPWLDHPKDAAFECAAVAAGCMLIKTKVLRAMATEGWVFNYDESSRSMDVRFCRNAGALGFEVWCLPNPPCEQVKHY